MTMTVYRGLSFFCYFSALVGLVGIVQAGSVLNASHVPIVIGVVITGVLFQFMHDVVTALRVSPPDAPSSVPTSRPSEAGPA